MDVVTEQVTLENQEEARALTGTRDEHLRRVRDAFGIRVSMRSGVITLGGSPATVQQAATAIGQMRDIVRERGMLMGTEVDAVID